MALIKCPECKKKISDQCENCPNCGFPIKEKINESEAKALAELETSVESADNKVIENETVAFDKKQKKPKKERKPVNKKRLFGIISIIMIALSVGGILGYIALLPRINATKDFKAAVKFVEQKNAELEAEISQSENLIAEKQPLLDETLIPALETAISEAKAAKITDLKLPKKVEDIISRTNKLNKTDYSDAIANLNDKHTALENDAEQYQLIKKDFDNAVKFVEQKNAELEAEISQSENLIAEKQPLLDETLIPALETAISEAKATKITDLKLPEVSNDIIPRTELLNKTDYSNAIANLNDKHTALEINAKRYQLVNAPTEAYVIQSLKTIPEITGISAATEDNDPMGNLNKAGGYTSLVIFSHAAMNQNEVYGSTLLEKGTRAGGGIEVYRTHEEAVKRCDYLAAFDGNPILDPGTHTVIGTVLVRTSDKLTASKQKDLEAKLIAALTYIEEVDGKIEPTVELQPEENQNPPQPTTSKPSAAIPEILRFEGGICSKIDGWGDGMPLDNINRFPNGQSAFIAGRVVGFSGKKSITIIWNLPDGTSQSGQIENLKSGDTFNLGMCECGMGAGTVSVIFTETGENLGTFSFEFY